MRSSRRSSTVSPRTGCRFPAAPRPLSCTATGSGRRPPRWPPRRRASPHRGDAAARRWREGGTMVIVLLILGLVVLAIAVARAGGYASARLKRAWHRTGTPDPDRLAKVEPLPRTFDWEAFERGLCRHVEASGRRPERQAED